MVQAENSLMRNWIRLLGGWLGIQCLCVLWLEATVNLRNIINRATIAPALIGNLVAIPVKLDPAGPVIV
jgi:hypothetical protein